VAEKSQELVSRFEAFGTTGLALERALSAQFEFSHRLVSALVASGALTPQAAEELFVSTARALEKRVPAAAAAAKTPYYTMVLERVMEHAKALRAIAGKVAKPKGRGRG